MTNVLALSVGDLRVSFTLFIPSTPRFTCLEIVGGSQWRDGIFVLVEWMRRRRSLRDDFCVGRVGRAISRV